MKRLLPIVAGLMLLAPASAQAIDPLPYSFCGGSYNGYPGFGFCASVDIGLAAIGGGKYRVTLTVANLSGTNGSYAGSLLTRIGLDNILSNLANPANIIVSQSGSVICTNTNNAKGQAANGCWYINEDGQGSNGSGKIDILTQTVNGVNRSLSSACPGGHNTSRIFTCLNAAPVVISFEVTGSFSTQAVQLYVKAQSGPQDQSTSCHTHVGSEICTPTVVPEPATLLLLGSGLASVVPVAMRRRRRTTAEERSE